jgi:hypothetical protein
MRLESFAYGAPAAKPACHMTANRMKSGTMSTRQSPLFLQPKLIITLYQSAIDFLSETLLWFGVRVVARNPLLFGLREEDHFNNVVTKYGSKEIEIAFRDRDEFKAGAEYPGRS